jgi:peptidoglycan/xylan/chitin deacetylase (PgdA/CDA1 family)
MRIVHLLRFLTPLFKLRRIATESMTGSVQILCYHDIPDSSISDFREQMTWLARRYPFLDPDSFHAFMDGRLDLQGRHILITFDDGFSSCRKVAEQVLAPLGIKAMFFIPVGFLDLPPGTEWREYVAQNLFSGQISENDVLECQAPMSWDDLLWLRSQGHGIGAHTTSHCSLSNVSDKNQLSREIIDAKNRIEQVLGEEIAAMAYPFGTLQHISKSALGLIGKHYRYCYSVVRGANVLGTKRLAIRRGTIGLDAPSAYAGFVVEDGLSWFYCFRRKKLDNLV